MKWIAGLMTIVFVMGAQAASIAVIDSGLDYKHAMITPNLWTNPSEVEDLRDNDGNGYQDDVHGWNFAEQNGTIIDYKHLGSFSVDCIKYFDVQGKIFLKTASEEEVNWLKTKQQDTKFKAELGKFGNFVHGTHVAGIAVKNSKNEAMGIKLIPTEIKPFLDGLSANDSSSLDRWELLSKGFDILAQQQMNLLAEIARFVNYHKMEVANGSFGTGFNQAKIISDNAFKVLFLRRPTAEESNKAASLFIEALLKFGKSFVGEAPDTLFVFAAGNDGMSNDDFGTSPANIKADNVITVGATYKNEYLAPFSNFGVKMVDVAAPGMLINSAVPGNEYLQVSGTSQAAPLVARLAGQIKDANDKLSAADIKRILIETVDKKAFLVDKVFAGGVVNAERSVVAAQISKIMPLALAIGAAKLRVKDAPSTVSETKASAVTPIPMLPMFK
jgi:subtilisin family serine protease